MFKRNELSLVYVPLSLHLADRGNVIVIAKVVRRKKRRVVRIIANIELVKLELKKRKIRRIQEERE
jgi:hypothetical protein